MKWGKPHQVAGIRLAIDSSCGRYCITRDEHEADPSYHLQVRRGATYTSLGEFKSKDDAAEAAEHDEAKNRYRH